MKNQSVQVKIDLGHRAILREEITDDGFTHDWTVFVRGPGSFNICNFVEKVIFHLHRDFAKPKRVVKEPPFEVSESGYGGFNMQIEVFFKQKEEPRKVLFDYDLFLKTNEPVNHFRCEKLTFHNPTEEFRKKLIKGGGVRPADGSLLPVASHNYQSSSEPNLSTEASSSQGNNKKNFGHKTPKLSNPSSSVSAPNNPVQLKDPVSIASKQLKDNSKTLPPATVGGNKSFVEVFGQPINTNKLSSDSQKVKNSQSKKSNSSSTKNSSAKESSKSNENSSCNNGSAKDVNKSQIKEKIFSKRSTSPSPDSPHSGHKKRKRSSSSPSSHGTSRVKESKESDSKSDKKASIAKSKSEKRGKSSERNSNDCKSDSKSVKEPKSVKKLKQEKPTASSPSLSTNSSFGSNNDVSRSSFTPPLPKAEADVCGGGGDESRSSTSSFSSVHQSKGSGPLFTLMEELDKEQGDQDDVLSPLSSDESPPRPFLKHEAQPAEQVPCQFSPNDIKSFNKQPHEHKISSSSKSKVKEEKSKETKSKKADEHKSIKKSSDKDSTNPPVDTTVKPPRPMHLKDITEEYITELQDLQRRIMLLKDRKHLQQIVNVIEETGRYQVTSTTFDFDLCLLDKRTVKKLQTCLSVIV
ncbi:myeloid lymphoid or mixed-lineage leukemia (trithorax, ) [Chamberlinius hualienensis]